MYLPVGRQGRNIYSHSDNVVYFFSHRPFDFALATLRVTIILQHSVVPFYLQTSIILFEHVVLITIMSKFAIVKKRKYKIKNIKMADLTTKYLGLELKSPIIIGSSELNNSVDRIKKHADAGAGAVVLKSLFEEQILMDIDAQRLNNMYNTYDAVEEQLGYYLKKHTVDNYLNLIKETKAEVDIPVIASINCVTTVEWIEFAKDIEKAGADALEVNMFILPSDTEEDSKAVEKKYFDIAEALTKTISIPVSLKVSSYFSGLASFIQKLSYTDIKGLVLFNKFYTPAIDIEKEEIVSNSVFSNQEDNSMPLRWIGILNGKVSCDLASSTGVHDSKDVISNLLVGANAVQMVTSIFKKGDDHISKSLSELNDWMDKKGYKSIEDFRGKLSQKGNKSPQLLERVQFMKYFADSGL